MKYEILTPQKTNVFEFWYHIEEVNKLLDVNSKAGICSGGNIKYILHTLFTELFQQ